MGLAKPLSLKARALWWLAQREHSRVELRRKLLRVAKAEEAQRATVAQSEDTAGVVHGASGDPSDEGPAAHSLRTPAESAAAPPAEPAETNVEQLLDWLQANRYLSEERFVESRVHARARRYGNLRISQELAQHGVSPDDDTWATLKATELERARQVWRAKFGAVASDPAGRARQMRFLAQRGFSSEAIRAVVKTGVDDDDDASVDDHDPG